jgi:molybdate transport system permease protein
LVFTKITLPLAFPALAAGAVTAWARALGEFGGTIVFAGSFQGITQTLPLAIYGTLERDFDAAVALSVLVLGFSFAVILAARFFTRRAEGHAGQD